MCGSLGAPGGPLRGQDAGLEGPPVLSSAALLMSLRSQLISVWQLNSVNREYTCAQAADARILSYKLQSFSNYIIRDEDSA